MRYYLTLFVLSLTVSSGFSAVKWYTDVNEAAAAAKAEKKPVLLDFTGSDWCVWCKRLKSEVFDTPEFQGYAAENLILVEVDFPESKPQSAEQKKANDSLAKAFKVDGYPTIVLLNSDGQPIGRGGYQEGGPTHYIEFLKNALHASDKASLAGTKPEPPKAEAPVTYVPAPKRVYTSLQLKGITGKTRRFALINGHTFAPGEEAKLTVDGKIVSVKCVTIGDTSVDVLVDGASAQLLLN